jgi:hypothetical protein
MLSRYLKEDINKHQTQTVAITLSLSSAFIAHAR